MLARTVLPPTVFTRTVAGSFTGSCPAAATVAPAPKAANADAAAATVTVAGAPEPTEVVLASATSLLLVRIWPDSAAAVPNHAEAAAAAMSEDGSGCSDGEAAREVLCEQPAFGAIVAIAACRQPASAPAQVSRAAEAVSTEIGVAAALILRQAECFVNLSLDILLQTLSWCACCWKSRAMLHLVSIARERFAWSILTDAARLNVLAHRCSATD